MTAFFALFTAEVSQVFRVAMALVYSRMREETRAGADGNEKGSGGETTARNGERADGTISSRVLFVSQTTCELKYKMASLSLLRFLASAGKSLEARHTHPPQSMFEKV